MDRHHYNELLLKANKIANKLKDREEVDDSDFISMCLDEKAQILEFDRNYTDQSECVFSDDE